MSHSFDPPPAGPVYGNDEPTPNYVPFANTRGSTIVLPTAQLMPPRNRGKMLAAVVGVAAILVAGTFALSSCRSNRGRRRRGHAARRGRRARRVRSTTRTSSAAIDLLLPGERETFRQPLVDLVDELSRIKVTDETATLEKLGGLDIEIEAPEITVDDNQRRRHQQRQHQRHRPGHGQRRRGADRRSAHRPRLRRRSGPTSTRRVPTTTSISASRR